MKLIKKKNKKSNNSNNFLGKILGLCGGMLSFIITFIPILIMLVIMIVVVLISGVAGAIGGKQAQDEGGGDIPNVGEVVILKSGAASPSTTAYIAYAVGDYGWFTGAPPGHTGMDFQLTNTEEPTVAPYDGEVVSVVDYCSEGQSVCPSTTYPTWSRWGGNQVVIKVPHPEDSTKDMFIGYSHLRKDCIYVKPGDKVTKGEAIALPGNTGNSYGIHHHVTLNIVNKGTPFSSAGGNTLVDPIMIFCGVPGTEKHSACTI